MAQPPIKREALDYGDTPEKIVTLDANDKLPHADGSLLYEIAAEEVKGDLTNATIDASKIDNLPPPNDSTISIAAGSGITGGGSFSTNQASGGIITLNHEDTSTQGSVATTASNCVKDITLDGFGHITGINTGSISQLPASAISSGTFDTERLGAGTADNTTFLRGDSTWTTVNATPPANSIGTTEIDFGTTTTWTANLGFQQSAILPAGLYCGMPADGDNSGVPAMQVYIAGTWLTIPGGTGGLAGTFFSDGAHLRVYQAYSGNVQTFTFYRMA